MTCNVEVKISDKLLERAGGAVKRVVQPVAEIDGVRFRIHPDRIQQQVLKRWIGAQRYIFNRKVEELDYHLWLKNNAKFSNRFHEPVEKYCPWDQTYAQYKESAPWLKEIPSFIQRNGCSRFRSAMANWGERCEAPSTQNEKGSPESPAHLGVFYTAFLRWRRLSVYWDKREVRNLDLQRRAFFRQLGENRRRLTEIQAELDTQQGVIIPRRERLFAVISQEVGIKSLFGKIRALKEPIDVAWADQIDQVRVRIEYSQRPPAKSKQLVSVNRKPTLTRTSEDYVERQAKD